MIASIKRYFDLLGWLLADIWSYGRGLILAVYGLDVLGMATMAGAYRVGQRILGQANGRSGTVQIWGHDLSVLGAVGLAAGLIWLALQVQSATRLGSHRLALNLAVRYESAAVIRMWERIREVCTAGKGEGELPDPGWMQRKVIGDGRALGTCARLGVMAISGTLTAVFYAALAVHSAPRTALIFLVVGLGIFGFILRNNQRAASANLRARNLTAESRTEVGELFRNLVSGPNEPMIDERLRKLYSGGVGSRATEAYAEQLFRVYQSQFLMATGAAFAIALALLMPLLEKQQGGGAVVPVALTAAGLVLLKMAFGFAGSVAGHLTRLNLRYHLLVEHRRFLRTGILPKSTREEGFRDESVEEE